VKNFLERHRFQWRFIQGIISAAGHLRFKI